MFAAKHLERFGDHATNLAEMVVYMVRGTDVRHPRSREEAGASQAAGAPSPNGTPPGEGAPGASAARRRQATSMRAARPPNTPSSAPAPTSSG